MCAFCFTFRGCGQSFPFGTNIVRAIPFKHDGCIPISLHDFNTHLFTLTTVQFSVCNDIASSYQKFIESVHFVSILKHLAIIVGRYVLLKLLQFKTQR